MKKWSTDKMSLLALFIAAVGLALAGYAFFLPYRITELQSDILGYSRFIVLALFAVSLILGVVSHVRWKRLGNSRYSSAQAAIYVAIVALVVAFSAVGPHSVSKNSVRCQNNLRLIEHAKGVWAVTSKKQPGEAVDNSDVNIYIKDGTPKCPDGGVYTYGTLGEDPTCSMRGDHAL